MKSVTSYVLGFFLLLSCSTKTNLTGGDYELFKNTPAWELAKAVNDEDEDRIRKLAMDNPRMINFCEPKFGSSLLMLTVINQQHKAFSTLLSLKADVTIHETSRGSSALIDACSYSHFDAFFVKALLEKGASPNDVEAARGSGADGTRDTPLIAAARAGRKDFTELLISYGADVNYRDAFGHSALSEAVLLRHYEIALFLLKQGADYTQRIFTRPVDNREMFLVDVLREDFFPLSSPEYKQKMEVVEFLKSKGIDYWSSPVPDFIKKKAQEQYPDSWTEYLKKY